MRDTAQLRSARPHKGMRRRQAFTCLQTVAVPPLWYCPLNQPISHPRQLPRSLWSLVLGLRETKLSRHVYPFQTLQRNECPSSAADWSVLESCFSEHPDTFRRPEKQTVCLPQLEPSGHRYLAILREGHSHTSLPLLLVYGRRRRSSGCLGGDVRSGECLPHRTESSPFSLTKEHCLQAFLQFLVRGRFLYSPHKSPQIPGFHVLHRLRASEACLSCLSLSQRSQEGLPGASRSQNKWNICTTRYTRHLLPGSVQARNAAEFPLCASLPAVAL